MSFDVKNTTFYRPFELLFPHTCRGCGARGELLCECCKNYMVEQRQNVCPKCHRALDERTPRCPDCKKLPFLATFVFSWREGALPVLVKEYKYQAVRGMSEVLAKLYAEMIGDLEGVSGADGLTAGSGPVKVVPLPTISRHIRERGFDHMGLVAKKLAKKRGWEYAPVLMRVNKTVQVGADEKTRRKQAGEAYAVETELDSEATYLLIDDVWTTGASMMAAAEKMQEAGAKRLAMAVLEVGK